MTPNIEFKISKNKVFNYENHENNSVLIKVKSKTKKRRSGTTTKSTLSVSPLRDNEAHSMRTLQQLKPRAVC